VSILAQNCVNFSTKPTVSRSSLQFTSHPVIRTRNKTPFSDSWAATYKRGCKYHHQATEVCWQVAYVSTTQAEDFHEDGGSKGEGK